ncbi:MAG: DUF835 domain-containing protein [Palaeococcus sp.]|uniref:DUF835 domain-containing protein n=1 Tax=Palaeococcus sp. (in: euryarchaeotes) TaxID=2820298 RepID=UPI0025D2F78B|nr:DUF835 domain-containing protein [Palaeococcus sp. (in: euryarchaeotes)]MCD6559845.1 DUF835 domain-containing protein [Palaeococcus sp. (in: euryarchaeotes)]
MNILAGFMIILNFIAGIISLFVFYKGLTYRKDFLNFFTHLKAVYNLFLAGFLIVSGVAFFSLFRSYDSYTPMEASLNSLLVLVFLLIAFSWQKLVKGLIEKEKAYLATYKEIKEIHIASGLYLCKYREPCLNIARAFIDRFESMIICREPPEVLRNKLDIGEDVKIWWLTKAEREDAIHPTRLPFMTYNIVEFINKENHKRFVLLDGIEYLILENGFESIYKFLTSLKDYAILYDAVILVPIDPDAYDLKEYNLLLREFEVLEEKRALFSSMGKVYVL